MFGIFLLPVQSRILSFFIQFLLLESMHCNILGRLRSLLIEPSRHFSLNALKITS
jgi:hypothetical protein